MNILDSQPEMHSAFLGGFAGQLVSGIIWLVAAGHGHFPAHPIEGRPRKRPSQ